MSHQLRPAIPDGTMSLETLISTYGYAAIVVGTFFEGETVLVLAGFAAHQGYLKLPWVLSCAFLGALCADQLYFYLGRTKGTQFLRKHPLWGVGSERVSDLLHRHGVSLMLGFRFLYGLRTLTPFLIGASRIPPVRFLAFDTLGATLWAGSIGVCGYLFGQVLELLIGKIERYELLLFIALALLGVVIWCIHWYKRRNKARRAVEPRK
jgi:membrane protein DedA with SNARE-associated domain